MWHAVILRFLAVGAAKTLTRLNLSNNGIGDAGAAALGQMLTSAAGGEAALLDLDVSWNRIAPAGASALLAGVAANRNLERLSLEWNRLGLAGGAALAAALAVHPALAHLDASSCALPEACGPALAAALTGSQALRTLRLAWNPLRGAVPILVPARGQLRLDFVHQRLPDDVDASLPQEGLEALLRLINRSLGSGGKLDCLRQVAADYTFGYDQALAVLAGLFKAVEREEAVVTLFARLRGRATALPRLLAQFFSRHEVEDLQDRLGPEHVLDEARPFGRWHFDLAKTGDMDTLRRMVAIRVAAGSAAAFHMVRLYTSGTPVLFSGVAGQGLGPLSLPHRELTDQELCGGWDKLGRCGILYATLEPVDGTAATIAVADPAVHPSTVNKSAGGLVRGPRKTSAEFDLLPLILDDLEFTVPDSTQDSIVCSGVGSKQGESISLFTHGYGSTSRRMRCIEPELRLVVVRAPPGVPGLIRIVGGQNSCDTPADKPFNPAWDGGRTVLLLEVDGRDTTATVPRVVEVLTPRGRTVLATAEVSWASPLRTVIQLNPVAGCGDEAEWSEDSRPLGVAQDMASRRQSVHPPAPQSPTIADTSTSVCCGSIPSSPCAGVAGASGLRRGRGFDPMRTDELREAKERRRSERRWKQWAQFRRQDPEDFAIQQVRVDYRRSGGEHIVTGALGEVSCVNYEVDLSLTAWAHTIPRLFTFTVSPGDNLELYANAAAKGLPSPNSYSWRGELMGQERVITVRPTDFAYVAGKYLVSIITAAAAVEFTLRIEVAPFSTALRHGDSILPGSGTTSVANCSAFASKDCGNSNSSSSKASGTGGRASRGLRPPTGIARIVEIGDRSGQALSQLVAYTEGRKKQYRFGASASPKTRNSFGGESSSPLAGPARPHSALA